MDGLGHETFLRCLDITVNLCKPLIPPAVITEGNCTEPNTHFAVNVCIFNYKCNCGFTFCDISDGLKFKHRSCVVASHSQKNSLGENKIFKPSV